MYRMSTRTNNRRKDAERTIKRAVMKHSVKKAFYNYTGNAYANIKSGKAPTKSMAMYRRMKMFPVTVNTPLYRGFIDRNGRIYKNLKENGVMKNSFSSFSKYKGTAESFAMGFPPTMNSKFIVLILPPGRYPAMSINNWKGRGMNAGEVVLAPGTYTINKNKTNFSKPPRFGYRSYLYVKYKPSNKLNYLNYHSL